VSVTFFKVTRLWLALAMIVGCQAEHKDHTRLHEGAMGHANGQTVIIIPGITGSELIDRGGERRWPPRMLSLFADFSALSSDDDGSPLTPLEPGFPIEDYYGTLPRRLEREGYKVRRFGYDWRLSNTINAERLRDFINASGQSSVSVVAHSMGGLVAASYVEKYGAAKIKKLITLGTPYLGTPGSLKTLERGDYLQGFTGFFLRQRFIDLFRNEASWYQLLPSPLYFSLTKSSYLRKIVHGSPSVVTGLQTYEESVAFIRSRPWTNLKLLKQSQAFAESLNLHAPFKNVDAYFIIGYGEPTIGGLDFVFHHDGKVEVLDDVVLRVANGDGAVVLSSANLGGIAEKVHPGHCFYVAEHHVNMFSNEVIFAQVNAILRGDKGMVAGMSAVPRELAQGATD